MDDCTPEPRQPLGPPQPSDPPQPLDPSPPAPTRPGVQKRQILAERERERAGSRLRSRACAREAEIEEVAARFEFALADELSFLSFDGSPCQLAMRLTHRRTRREHAVVICRRTAAGEQWEVLCCPWFDDEAHLYLRVVQERVARNRAARLAGEGASGGGEDRCADDCGAEDRCGKGRCAVDWDAAGGGE